MAQEVRQTPLRRGQRFRPGMLLELETPPKRIRIEDALLSTLEVQIVRKKTLQDYTWTARQFLKWAGHRARYWDELTSEHVAEYERFLWNCGFAADTVRLRIAIVRKTAGWMSRAHGFLNICEGFRLRRRQGDVRVASDRVLSIAQVCELLAWLEQSERPARRELALAVALQGLAGLRLTEALRLRWDDVDWEAGTVTIQGVVKNRYSARCIPIAHRVRECLEGAEKRAERLLCRFAAWTSLGHAIGREMRLWSQERSVPPKDLRKTVPTAAAAGDWDSLYVNRYLGHAPQTIKERYYQRVAPERLISLLREHVVAHIDREVGFVAGECAQVIPLRLEA